MKKNEKGLTLLEAVFAIMLFAILTSLLLNFFSTMYTNAKFFEKQAYLNDSARTVNAYVKEKIREADQVKVTLQYGATFESGKITDAAGNPKILNDGQIVQGQLQKIELKNEGQLTGTIFFDPSISSGARLYYQAQGDTNKIPISDVITECDVIHEAKTDDIKFCCTYRSKEPIFSVERETIKDEFSVSLSYKAVSMSSTSLYSMPASVAMPASRSTTSLP